MIPRIVGASLRARLGVVLAAAVVMAVGVWQLRSAPVDVLPEFGPPTVEVQTEALGLSSEEVEQLITVPLEQDLLDGVAWLDHIRSESVPGLSSVHLVFEPGTDLYRARQVVQERISQAAGLPNVSRPPQMLQPRSSVSRAAMVALSSKELTPIQIGVLARWTIRPRLLAVPGVSNVAIWGQRERQLQVQVDPQRMRERGVTLERVISSTGNALWVSPLTFLEASTPGTGGFVDTPSQRIGIQHNLPIVRPQDLAQIPIDESPPGVTLTLGDVATVVEDHQPLIGDAIVDGAAPDGGYLLVVEKLPNANTSDVAKGIDEALDGLRPGLSGLELDTTIFRAAGYVATSVGDLARAALAGALLLGIVLLLFLGWRAALAAAVAVSLSIVTAALAFDVLGGTFDIVVLTGLGMALAVVVYDAVAGVERVVRGRRTAGEPGDAGTTAAIVRDATIETGRTAAWATIVLAAALAPLFFVNGLSGDAFFPPLAVAALVSVLASLLVAVTVTPALSLLLLSGAAPAGSDRRAGWLERGYDRWLAPATRSPVPALVAIGLVALAAAVVVPRAEVSLLPPLQDPNLVVQWTAAPGTSLPEMDRITGRAAGELRAVPGVRTVATQVGQAVLGDQAVGSDSAQTWIRLDDGADHAAAVAAIERVIAGYPGLRGELLTYASSATRSVLGRTGDEITVRVFGSDLGVLHDKADEIRARVAGIHGVSSARVASMPEEPTMEVEVDLAKAREAGIKPGDVRRAAATLLSGIRVGNLFEDQKVFDVQIWSTPATRTSVSSVQELPIDTPSGTPVRLGDVAALRIRSTPPVIRHEDISRYVDVAVDVRGRSVGRVSADVRDEVAKVGFPLEYHAELLGDYAADRAAVSRLVSFAVAAAVGVFLLLQAAFRSWRLALVCVAVVPVAVAGGLVAAWVDSDAWTLATVAGSLAVVGVAVRSFVALVAGFQRLRADGAPFGPEVVDRGTRQHVAPAVLSALAGAVLLLPLVVLGPVEGLEILHPMAVVVVGGLVTTTLSSLLLLPALYLRFGPRVEPEPIDLADELDEADRELASGRAGG